MLRVSSGSGLSGGYAGGEEIQVREETQLDLHRSSYEELSLAKVYTRKKVELSLANGYHSEDDQTDEDEQDGTVYTEKKHHANGQIMYIKTYQILPGVTGPDGRRSRPTERMVEEKHYNPDGVCMLDNHFALGQP